MLILSSRSLHVLHSLLTQMFSPSSPTCYLVFCRIQSPLPLPYAHTRRPRRRGAFSLLTHMPVSFPSVAFLGSLSLSYHRTPDDVVMMIRTRVRCRLHDTCITGTDTRTCRSRARANSIPLHRVLCKLLRVSMDMNVQSGPDLGLCAGL